jgi:hypothetical protein
MPESEVPAGREWSYRFTQPGGVEIAARDLNGDETAVSVARELSTSAGTPVIIHRLQRLADSWEYVTEVDERPDV